MILEILVRRSTSNFLLANNDGLDLVSCLHFLFDLYSHWLDPDPDRVPLTLLAATVQSLYILSDLMSDRSQVEWLRSEFRSVGAIHSSDDELIQFYIGAGLLKADAILGMVSLFFIFHEFSF